MYGAGVIFLKLQRCTVDATAVVGGKRVELVLTVVDDELAGIGSSSSSTVGKADAHGVDLLQSGAVVLQMKSPTGKPCAQYVACSMCSAIRSPHALIITQSATSFSAPSTPSTAA
jgi:hypothetical protein